jgi:hypothetical protein
MYGISPGTAQRSDRPTGADCAGGGSGALSRKPTFSQPYFAEFENELKAAAEAAEAAEAAQTAGGGGAAGKASTPVVTGLDAAAGGAEEREGPSAEDSGAVRAVQLSSAQGHMTADELHEVGAGLLGGGGVAG